MRLLQKIKKRIEIYIWDVLVNTCLMSYIVPLFIRRFILRIITKGGCQGVIHGHVYLEGKNISLGKHSYINRNASIYNANASVAIGENCSIAYGVAIHTTNHQYDNSKKRAGSVVGSNVIVEDGCWIGANAIILPGSVIHSGCVIGAGSLVNGECCKNSLYVGVPAKKIRNLPEINC